LAKDDKKTLNETKPEDSPTKEAKKVNTKINSKEKGAVKQDSVNDLKEQLDLEKDRVLRLSAEFENFRKRNQRELEDFKRFANETVFKHLLTVVDNLERAILSVENNSAKDSLLDGVKLTHKEIIKLFEMFNVKPVEAENQPFDPNFHQAVNQKETDDLPENTVTEVLQKGYLLHDRLIRPAMVVVSKKIEKETEKTTEK